MPAKPAGAARKPRTAKAAAPGKKPRAPARRDPSPTPVPDDAPEDDAPEVAPYTPLQKAIATIFSQAQRTTAGHRKLVVNLRATFDQCLTGEGSIGSTIGVTGRHGEKLFTAEFSKFLERVLNVKKSEVVGDRCLRLVDLFVRNLVNGDKDKKKAAKKPDAEGDVEMAEDEEDEDEEPFKETSATRVVLRLLNQLTNYFTSKEKVIRYRATQLLALLLSNSLPTFPFDYSDVSLHIFKLIRVGLVKRLTDKEAVVRTQAAVGLIRLHEMGSGAGSDEEADSDDEDASSSSEGIVGVLLEALQNDPSSDVRRTILYNLSPTPKTIAYLLERSRDVDSATRRSVFTKLLPTLGDFRHLTIGMREKLLRWGLNDRDESVRAAARKMFNFQWVEDANGDLLEVLERLDITSEGIDGGPKDLALKGFWEQRKDVVEQLEFDDDYWENLTPESTFLVRSFNEYCRVNPEAGVDIDEKMPEASKIAFYLQRYINDLVNAMKAGEDEEAAGLEFIAQQLLLIASSMDYGDEIGRRKMFALLRESLGVIELSETITRLVVEGLKKLSVNESDYSMLILEVISDIHDTILPAGGADDEDDADSFRTANAGSDDEDVEDTITVRPPNTANTSTTSATGAPPKRTKSTDRNKRPSKRIKRDSSDDILDDLDKSSDASDSEGDSDAEPTTEDEEAETLKAIRELTVNLKCLHISQCMLENISGGFKSNTHMVTMLNGLIVPAVRSHEAPVRERGLRCLGLSCLLDRTLSEENLSLFIHCFNKGHESLQIDALHIIGDILLTHGTTLFDSPSTPIEAKQLYRLLSKAIKSEDTDDSVQSTAAEVICKLLLTNVVRDEELLKTLVIAYFDPATAGNNTLRQTLSYFLPVYCHSLPANAHLMATIATPTLHSLLTLRDYEGSTGEMVAPTTIAAHLVEWTDPRKTVNLARTAVTEKVADASIHAVLAAAVLDRAALPTTLKEERKLLVSGVVAKCWIPKEAGAELLREVYDGVCRCIEGKVVGDVAGKNVLAKLESVVGRWVQEIEEEERPKERTVVMRDVDMTGDETGAGEEEEDGEETVTAGGEETVIAGGEEGEVERSEVEQTPALTEAEESDA